MLRRRGDEEGPRKVNWLITYGCLMTQLLVFFVMLFALANKTTEFQLKAIKKNIDQYVVDNNLQDRIRTDLGMKEKGLVISLGDNLMFEPGKAELARPEARELVSAIAGLIQADPDGNPYPNDVNVEGHTDNVPVRNNPQFASNWELSAARATNITRFLVEDMQFDPSRLSSSGYAEWWPARENFGEQTVEEIQRIPPRDRVEQANDTLEKRARNRRVDIVVRRLEMYQIQEWRDRLMRAVSKAMKER